MLSPACSRRYGPLAFPPHFSLLWHPARLVASLLPLPRTHAFSCLGQAQGRSGAADVATNMRASTPYRFNQVFSVVVLIFLLLLSFPRTYAFRAIPMRTRASSESAPTSTMTTDFLKKTSAITRPGSGLCLLSFKGSTSSSPATHTTTFEISASPVAAADEDPPSLLTPFADEGASLFDLVTMCVSLDKQVESITPSELVACLKAPEFMGGIEPELSDAESIRHSQTLFFDFVTTKLDAFSLQDLATLIQASAISFDQQSPFLPSLFDLLLDTTTLRMRAYLPPSLPPTIWVHLALASTSLPPFLKARPTSHRFLQELTTNLPLRLSTLSPSDLVQIIRGWPRESADLDDFSCKLIQAILLQSINSLHAFDPSALIQLMQGLRRPMTPTRLSTLEALDETGQETPDLNSRQRLYKAAIKTIARRHIHQLSPRELSVFIQACVTDLSFADWSNDLGVAFPRTYATAALKHIPHMAPLQLLPTLSAILFLRSAFNFTPDRYTYNRLAKMAVEKVEEGGREGGEEDPSVLLPLLHTFALFASPEYDPGEVLEILTCKMMKHLPSFTPSSFRCLVETLALPGHSYVPSSGMLTEISYHAVSQLLSHNGGGAVAATAGTAATATGDSSIIVDYGHIIRSLTTISVRKGAASWGLRAGMAKGGLGEEEQHIEGRGSRGRRRGRKEGKARLWREW